MNEETTCKVCYQIRCRQCGWIADDEATARIQARELTACPICGWSPKEE